MWADTFASFISPRWSWSATTRVINGRRIGPERLAHELERVAQPFAGDPQLVERLDVGPAEHGLVASNVLVGAPDAGWCRVADAMGLHRADRDDRSAFGPDEVPVVIDPAPVAVRVELAHEQHARVVAMLAPAAEQRLEAALLDLWQVRAVEIGRVEQDIEIAHGPEAGRDLAQARAVAFRAAATERIAEDAPRGTLPAGRNTHRVELLVVLALARARLAGEHPGEVEAQDLASCLGDVVVGDDAGRLDGRQAGRLAAAVRPVLPGARPMSTVSARCPGRSRPLRPSD